jgi:DtxR family transcriptional regulator, Mn-dependent transcriptional regulator
LSKIIIVNTLKMIDFSSSEENYVKAIYGLSESNTLSVSTNDLALKMDSKPSSITDMLRKLADKGLIQYQKYQGCTLSQTGVELALSIIRKHRLWEVFLVNKLGFKWDEVHEIAEQLEHVQSSELTNKLDLFLDFPKTDPHGDPIPDSNGKIEASSHRINLSKANVLQTYRVMGVEDGQVEFLQYLNEVQIGLGTELFLDQLLSFDGSAWVQVNGQRILLSKGILSRIEVCLAL